MSDEENYYEAIPPVYVVDKCVTCGASVKESLEMNTECIRQGHNCYFEVHSASAANEESEDK